MIDGGDFIQDPAQYTGGDSYPKGCHGCRRGAAVPENSQKEEHHDRRCYVGEHGLQVLPEGREMGDLGSP